MSGIVAALINGGIVSILVTAAVWLGMRAMHRRLNAATRYLVWWTVLVIVVILPVWYLPGDPLPRAAEAPPRQSLPARVVPREAKGPDSPLPPVTIVARPAPSSRRPRFPLRIPAGRVPQWFAAAWALLSFLMLLRLTISWEVLRRRKARATEAPPSLSARLDAWLAQCGSSRRKVRVAVSAEIVTPMVAGMGHPSILFPRNLLGALSQAELEQIGLHEAAHLARGDDCVLIIQRIVEALFALHPVVRWVARRIDLEREIACDDFVVQAVGNPRPYAMCLTRVVELTNGGPSSVVAAAAADERSHLTRRVDMLLEKSRHIGTQPLKLRLGAGVAIIASVAGAAAHAPGMIVFSMPIAREYASAALVAGIAAHLAPSPPPSAFTKPAPQASPRSSAPLQTASANVVTIPVVVREPGNRVVTGLDKVDFRLFEDGVEQEITHLGTSEVPLSVALLIDISSTKSGKFSEVEEAVRRFLRVANPFDEFIVRLSEKGGPAIGFTGDREEVQRHLAQIQPHGGTALFDAVSLAMREMQGTQNSRKVVLVITDAGGDGPSGYPQSRLLQEPKMIVELVQGNVPVYALNITDSNDPPAHFLAELTSQTGGRLFTIDVAAATMPDVAAQLGIELRNLYALEYTPRNTAHNGAYRNIQIEVIAHPGLPPLSLYYRRGYYESR